MLANRPGQWSAREWLILAGWLLPRAGRERALPDLQAALSRLFPHSVSHPVNAGRTALRIALGLARTRHPDRAAVIVPDYICPSVPEAVAAQGMTICPCPVRRNLVLNADAALAMMTRDTLAIIVVHMYGYPADMERIQQRARDLDIVVIDDAAQVLGAGYPDGTPLGARGDFGILSFALFKTVCAGPSGMGGVLLVNRDAWRQAAHDAVAALPPASARLDADFILFQATGREFRRLHWMWGKLLRALGAPPAGLRAPGVGMARMPSLAAALAQPQIDALDRRMACKRSVLQAYRKALARIEAVDLPQLDEERYLTRLMIEVASLEAAERLRCILQARGIPARKPYPRLTAKTEPPAAALEPLKGLLELPSNGRLRVRDVDRIANAVASALTGAP